MKINKKTAFAIWEEQFGDCKIARDFSGRWMVKDAYGVRDAEEELSDFTNDKNDEGIYVDVGWASITSCRWPKAAPPFRRISFVWQSKRTKKRGIRKLFGQRDLFFRFKNVVKVVIS